MIFNVTKYFSNLNQGTSKKISDESLQFWGGGHGIGTPTCFHAVLTCLFQRIYLIATPSFVVIKKYYHTPLLKIHETEANNIKTAINFRNIIYFSYEMSTLRWIYLLRICCYTVIYLLNTYFISAALLSLWNSMNMNQAGNLRRLNQVLISWVSFILKLENCWNGLATQHIGRKPSIISMKSFHFNTK